MAALVLLVVPVVPFRSTRGAWVPTLGPREPWLETLIITIACPYWIDGGGVYAAGAEAGGVL